MFWVFCVVLVGFFVFFVLADLDFCLVYLLVGILFCVVFVFFPKWVFVWSCGFVFFAF